LALIPGALLTWLLNYILNFAGILRGDSRFNRRMANGTQVSVILKTKFRPPTKFLCHLNWQLDAVRSPSVDLFSLIEAREWTSSVLTIKTGGKAR
jgi:hypothetical protein